MNTPEQTKQPDLAYLINLAKKGGALIKEKADHANEVSIKSGWGNYVTDVDLAVETILLDQITTDFPDDALLTEESNNDESQSYPTGGLWIIDPIDGTSNFVYRRNKSAVSIAYAYNGIIQLGCVYDPFLDECYAAERSEGSSLNGTKLIVTPPQKDERLSVSTDNSTKDEILEKHLAILQAMKPKPWVTMTGSAALAICYVAAGKLHGYFHWHMHAWDVAAGLLIAREAGAVSYTFNDSPGTYRDPDHIIGHETTVRTIQQFIPSI